MQEFGADLGDNLGDNLGVKGREHDSDRQKRKAVISASVYRYLCIRAVYGKLFHNSIEF